MTRAIGRDEKRDKPVNITLYKNVMGDEEEARKVLSEISTLRKLQGVKSNLFTSKIIDVLFTDNDPRLASRGTNYSPLSAS